jgi:hypothetical protein
LGDLDWEKIGLLACFRLILPTTISIPKTNVREECSVLSRFVSSVRILEQYSSILGDRIEI